MKILKIVIAITACMAVTAALLALIVSIGPRVAVELLVADYRIQSCIIVVGMLLVALSLWWRKKYRHEAE
jgi:hypothetical protein